MQRLYPSRPYVYCLLVTQTVIGGDGDEAFVPHLGVTGSVLLSILSLCALRSPRRAGAICRPSRMRW
ncbi:MAG TPA: hypothetical protein VNA04_02635 [Thermoanaerobaculia bacterium]|nr:hypothetical protein [Thermoanaerobaculia bacterium]